MSASADPETFPQQIDEVHTRGGDLLKIYSEVRAGLPNVALQKIETTSHAVAHYTARK